MKWPSKARVRALTEDTRDLVAYRAAARAGDAMEEERLGRILLECDPNDHVLLFDLALAAKRRRDWAEAAALNERALAVMTKIKPGEPAAWNLGIAATALGDWPRARAAWRTFGVEVPDGDGPVLLDGLGPIPVRLNPTGTQLGEVPLLIGGNVHPPEVVWTERLSPAHARVVNVPSGDSGHRFGDIVLTDGVPHGERFDGHGWVPVFDELELLERSDHSTWAATVHAPSPHDLEDLAERAMAIGMAVEDWSSALRILCQECSEGRPRHKHPEDSREWSPERSIGVAAEREGSVPNLLDAWAMADGGRAYSGLERVC